MVGLRKVTFKEHGSADILEQKNHMVKGKKKDYF
jgi:hypothetical protein